MTSGCSNIADLSILLDMSGSVQKEQLPKVLTFIENVLDPMDISPSQTMVSLVTFSDRSDIQFNFTTHRMKEDAKDAIMQMTYTGGRTNTAAGINKIIDLYTDAARGRRSSVPRYCILITDGQANVNRGATLTAAIKARRQGIYIIVVAINIAMTEVEVYGVASAPKWQNIYMISSFSALATRATDVSRGICNCEYIDIAMLRNNNNNNNNNKNNNNNSSSSK